MVNTKKIKCPHCPLETTSAAMVSHIRAKHKDKVETPKPPEEVKTEIKPDPKKEERTEIKPPEEVKPEVKQNPKGPGESTPKGDSFLDRWKIPFTV